VITLVDTSGAFPGVRPKERGQAEAIARSTEQCLALGVPLVAAIVGEGGSGGADRDRRRQSRADAREQRSIR
jgi:acetyl-CoA carboxylase carboxyl transferase subunit alpha